MSNELGIGTVEGTADGSRRCIRDGCGGVVVRHSLGCAQSLYRCTRCFQDYDRRAVAASGVDRTPLRQRVSDAWREFVVWQDK